MEEILVDDIEIHPSSPGDLHQFSEDCRDRTPEPPEASSTVEGQDYNYTDTKFEDSDKEFEAESLLSDLSFDDDENGEEEGKTCPVCGKVLAIATSLEYHMMIHTGERPFPCQLCDRSFKVRAELNQHLRLDHEGQKPIACDLCDMRFKRTDEMKRHRRIHTGEKPYKCTFCDKAFAHRSPWRQHEETHSREKSHQCETCGVRFEYSTAYAEHVSLKNCKFDSFICCGEVFIKRMDYVMHKQEKHNENKKTVSCSHCGKGFAFPYALKLHEQTHVVKKEEEPKTLPAWCVTCGQDFNSRSTLFLHRHSEHPDLNPFQCKYCGRVLASIGALRSHERHHVSDTYLCNVCGEKLDSRAKYFAHRRSHKNSELYGCRYCGKTLANAAYLSNHLRTHTGEKPYVCDICSKGFVQKQALTAHIRIHTKERPFKCSFCGQTFSYYSAMKCHERMHTGEKPYECQYCKQRFTRFGTYQNHVRLHTGEKPHVCTVCGKRFTQRSTQLSHMKTHEKKYIMDPNGTPSVVRRARNVRRQIVQTEDAAVATVDEETSVFVAPQQISGPPNQVMFTEDGLDGSVTKVVLTGDLENFDPTSLANVVFSGNVDAETIAKLLLGGSCVEGADGNVVYTENVDENSYIITEDGVSDAGETRVFFTENLPEEEGDVIENGGYELVCADQMSE